MFSRLKLIQAMVSVLGSNTDGSAPQSSLDRINMGLPSSLDSLPGKSQQIDQTERLKKDPDDKSVLKMGPNPDHGARARVHQLLSQPAPLRQDVKQLPTRLLTGG